MCHHPNCCLVIFILPCCNQTHTIMMNMYTVDTYYIFILYIHIIYSYYIFILYIFILYADIYIINYVTVEFPLTTGSDTSWHTRTRWPSLTIQNSHSAALRTQLPSTQQIGTPWKINMEPTNHPFRKENDLPNHHFQVPCSSSRVYPHITRGPK